jgi:hypothetical protein
MTMPSLGTDPRSSSGLLLMLALARVERPGQVITRGTPPQRRRVAVQQAGATRWNS